VISLTQGCDELKVALSEGQFSALQDYVDLLLKWNKTMNLISRRDVGRVIERHILDSLTGVDLVTGDAVLDVGSGAGLPGIPLAIAAPERAYALCDRMTRRGRFLQQAVRELGLTNVTVISEDVVELPENLSYDTIVARAVGGVGELWDLLNLRLNPGGRLLVYSSTQLTDAEDTSNELKETDAPEQTEVVAEQIKGAKLMAHRFDIPGINSTHTICEITKI
jgi:16S rRNA (guanine527-N7)-methyltransferase